MTTNQTIDGVPRELLERIARAGIWQNEVKELRALLDAKSDHPECSGNPASCPENEGFGCCKENPCITPAGAVCPGDGVGPCKKCPAEQPAPVAVVLPTQEDFERFIIRRDGSVNVSVLGKSRFYNDPTIDREYFVWLTCLDEVTRLNPSL